MPQFENNKSTELRQNLEKSEELREALLDFERSSIRERESIFETEVLLEGLAELTISESESDIFLTLHSVMKKVTKCENTYIFQIENNEKLNCISSSRHMELNEGCPFLDFFRQVDAEKPLIIFDISLVTKNEKFLSLIKENSKSVLCVQLRPLPQESFFICTHSESGFFNISVVKRLKRFSKFVLQALKNLDRFIELKNLNEKIKKEMEEKVITQRKLEESKIEAQLSYYAGMSEVATDVLHNVGNVLNSVLISAEFINQTLNQSKIPLFHKSCALLKEKIENFGEFYLSDPRGKNLLNLYIEIDGFLKREFDILKSETSAISGRLDLIKSSISSQQTYAKNLSGLVEQIDLIEIVENTLTMQSHISSQHKIKIIKIFKKIDLISCQKERVVHIILNIIKNAQEAMFNNKSDCEKILLFEIDQSEHTVSLKITDTGSGIEKENLDKMFKQNFTTKKTGHGFGLHYCANSMREMGGEIFAESGGFNKGTKFTLLFQKKPTSQPCQFENLKSL